MTEMPKVRNLKQMVESKRLTEIDDLIATLYEVRVDRLAQLRWIREELLSDNKGILYIINAIDKELEGGK